MFLLQISRHKEKIQDISTTASNEATLERMLQKVVDLWQSTYFRLVAHTSGSVMIIAGADDIMAMLEESQVTIGTIRGSRYITPIKVSACHRVSFRK
jgi:dynein heavy chain